MCAGGKKDDGKTRRPCRPKVVRRISDKQRSSGRGSQNPESFQKHVGRRLFRKSVPFTEDTGQLLPEIEMLCDASSRIALFVRDDTCRNFSLGKLFQNLLRAWQGICLVEDNPVVVGPKEEDPFVRLFFRNDASERILEGGADNRQHVFSGKCPVNGQSIQNGLERAVDGAKRVDESAVEVKKNSFRKIVWKQDHLLGEFGKNTKRVVCKCPGSR